MAKRDFAFGKENFILIAVAVTVIIIGFDDDRFRPYDCRNPEKQQK